MSECTRPTWRLFLLLGIAPLLGAPAAGAAGDRAEREAAAPWVEQLADKDPERRRAAVGHLADLATEESWRHVLSALADPSGRVADEAAWRLAEMRSPKASAAFFRQDGLAARDEEVRRRCAEIVGRMATEIDGETLAGRFVRSDPEQSRRLARSVELLARAHRLGGKLSSLLGALEDEFRSGRSDEVKCAALLAFGAVAALTPEPRARERFERLLRTAAKDSAGEMRSAALLAHADLDPQEQRERALQALADGESCVRLQAIEVLRTSLDRGAAAALAARLAHEPVERVAWRVVDVLRAASGFKYRRDPRPWQDWARALPEDWRGQARLLSPAEGAESGRSKTSFAGLPVTSERICFLVDFSGSLWMERADGTVRKAFADRVLREALEALPPSAKFNVVPYTKDPHPWSPQLVAATPANVRAAVAWFEACTERGSGDVYEAACLALDDHEVDAIVCLTDGAPTGGVHWRLEILLPLLADRARFRRTSFEIVLIDAPPRLAKPWQGLAVASGGSSIVLGRAPTRSGG